MILAAFGLIGGSVAQGKFTLLRKFEFQRFHWILKFPRIQILANIRDREFSFELDKKIPENPKISEIRI